MVEINDRRNNSEDGDSEKPGIILDSSGVQPTPPVEEVIVPDAPDYDKINFEMQGDRILLQDFPTSKKIGSIYTPDGREIDVNRARIVAIGNELTNKTLHVGDVIFKMHGLGQSLTTNSGETYIFLPSNSAIAKDTDLCKPVSGPKKESK